MKNINHVIKILLLFLFLVNVSDGLWAPILAVFVTKDIIGATLSTVGFAAGIFAVVKSIVQIPVARLLDRRINERYDLYVMVGGGIIGTISTFGFLIIENVWQLYMLSAISGFAAALLMAAYYAVFSHHTDKGSEAFEWSLYSVGGLTISSAIGGAVGGVMADTFGFAPTFFLAGVLSLLATGLLFALYPYVKDFRPRKEAVKF